MGLPSIDFVTPAKQLHGHMLQPVQNVTKEGRIAEMSSKGAMRESIVEYAGGQLSESTTIGVVKIKQHIFWLANGKHGEGGVLSDRMRGWG